MSQHNMASTKAIASKGLISNIVRFIQLSSIFFGVIAALMILTAVIITCQMIWVRYVLELSTTWQTEAVKYLVIAATILGLPFVQLHKGHVSVDLLPLLLSTYMQKVLKATTLFVAIIITSIVLYYGYELFYMAYERNWKSDTIWAVPMWIPYLCLPVGFAAYTLQLFADLLLVLTGKEDDSSIKNKEES